MTGPWISGESLSPSRLNVHGGSATLATGFSSNTLQPESGTTVQLLSGLSVQQTVAAQCIELGGPPSTTSGVLALRANSAQTDYLFLQDATGAKSNFLLGLRTGDSAASWVDGLNLYDTSHNTMIVRFSNDSVRFYPPIVAPIFDTGGALASTYNASLFLRGSSKESQIQAAINAAAADGVRRVYVPASLLSYNAASISFDSRVQMVREGGNWSVWDVWAYGATGLGVADDSSAFSGAIAGVPETANTNTGGVVYVPGGRYIVRVTSTRPAITLQGEGAGMNPATVGNNATILQSNTGTILDIGDATQTLHNGWVIRDLHFRDSSETGGATYGVRVRRMRHVNFDRVSFSRFTGTTAVAVYLDGAGNFVEYPEFYGCRFSQCRIGIDTVNADAVRVFGGHWENSAGAIANSTGISIGTGSDTLKAYGIAFENYTTSIDLNGAANGYTTVVGCRFEEIPQSNSITGIRSRTSNNQIIGCNFTGMAAGVSIDSGARGTIILGLSTNNVTSDVSDGAPQLNATKVISDTQFLYRSFTGSIDGAAGFFDDIRNESGSNKHLPSMLVSRNRGIQIKDDSAVTGGLFVSSEGIADGTNHICEIAGGAYGDVQTDLRSALSAAAGIRFVNHQMQFWANTGLTAGTAFTRGMKMKVDSSGVSAFYADGSALAPTLSFNSENSLGLFRSASSTLALSYGSLTAPILNATGGGNGVVLTGGTNNRVSWGAVGAAAPTVTSYSNGVKAVFYDSISGSAVGYTLGVDANTLFFTVPTSTVGDHFKWYGGTSVMAILENPGGWRMPDATALAPAYGYSSESSLGLFRSGVSTLALSYGSLNLNQARLVSIRTAASLDSTSLATNEMAFQIVAGSVATLAIRSGGTIYFFASSASTKG